MLFDYSGLDLDRRFDELDGMDIVYYLLSRPASDIDNIAVKHGYVNGVNYIGKTLEFIAEHGIVRKIHKYIGDNVFHNIAINGKDEYIDALDKIYRRERYIPEVNQKSTDGLRPLDLVSLPDNLDVFVWLMSLGANPYLFSDSGLNAVANIYYNKSPMPLHTLIAATGINPYVEISVNGDTLLHLAIKLVGKSNSSYLLDQISSKKDLFQRLVDVPNAKHVTPLMLACKYGKDTIVKLLLDQGANVHLKDRYGNTCLHYAITREVVDLIKDRGLDLQTKNAFYKTPLECLMDRDDERKWDLIRYYVFNLKVEVTDEDYAFIGEKLNLAPRGYIVRWEKLVNEGKTQDIVDILRKADVELTLCQDEDICRNFLRDNLPYIINERLQQYPELSYLLDVIPYIDMNMIYVLRIVYRLRLPLTFVGRLFNLSPQRIEDVASILTMFNLKPENASFASIEKVLRIQYLRKYKKMLVAISVLIVRMLAPEEIENIRWPRHMLTLML
jgi:ankyrin repeat protein